MTVYGNVMNLQNVTKWCSEFSEGRTDVRDERRSSRPSLISYELLHEIEGEIRANRRVTIRELHHIVPEVSKTTIHEAVTENAVLPPSNEHGSQVKDQGRRQCCHNKHKKFPYQHTCDVSLLSGHASYFITCISCLMC